MFRIFLLFISLFTAAGKTQCQCTADAGPDVVACAGSGGVTIGGAPTGSSGSGAYTYNWTPAAGLSCTNCANPVADPASSTAYTVTIDDGAGCVDTDQVTVTASSGPNASFSASSSNLCASIPIQFTSSSVGTGLAYSWNFDNTASGTANTSNDPNPQHTFVSIGSGIETFNVTLNVTDANGCADQVTQTITIQQSPDAALTDPLTSFRNCDGSNFNITVFNFTNPANNTSYDLDWGDGTAPFSAMGSFTSASHTYTTQNVFDLTLTVTGTNGCVGTKTYQVSNLTDPAIGVANPGGLNGCGPLNLCFPLSNYNTNHPSTIYTIDYGDNSPVDTIPHSPPPQICYTYNESSCAVGGSYTFSISAINACGVSLAAINPIRVFTAPQADFTAFPDTQCVNIPVTFTNTSILGFNSTCSQSTIFTWDFGDGSATVTDLAGAPQSHAYAAPGMYTITLSAQNGCNTTTVAQSVFIEVPPSPSFTVNPDVGCVPFNVSISNTSDTASSYTVTSLWNVLFNGSVCAPGVSGTNFINNTGNTDWSPEISFTNPGNYDIELTLTSSCGVFSTTKPVVANTIPQMILAPLGNICSGTSVNPAATFNNCDLPITAYNWTFSGGTPTTSNQEIPGTITFNTVGTQTITVEATNGCGTSISDTTITVNPQPSAPAINATTSLCEGDILDLSTTSISSGIIYAWNGPNGFTSNIQNPQITNVSIANAGTYELSIEENGCQSPSSTIDVVIQSTPVVTVIPLTPTICEGDSIQLEAQGAASYNWSPSVGLNSTTGAAVTAGPTSTTIYSVTGTQGGCDASATVMVTVHPLPLVDAGPNLTLCNQPIPEQLTAMPAGGTWSGPNITPGGEFTPFGAGIFEVIYSYIDGNGCENEDTIQVEVQDPATITMPNDTAVCINSGVFTLSADPVGGNWSGGGVDAAGNFTALTPGTVTLTYSIGTGSCASDGQVDVTVNNLPVIDPGTDFSLCIDGNVVTLNATPAGGTWSGNGVTGGQFDPAAAGTGGHVLTYDYMDPATDCSNSATITATVTGLPVVDIGPDITLCNQPIAEQLTGIPAGGTWSGTNVTPAGEFTPNGVGVFTLIYNYTDGNGCGASDQLDVTVINPLPADAGSDVEACLNDPLFNLTATPAGGSWSGTGITSNGDYTPSTVGTYTLIYTVGSGTCLTTDDVEVTVNNLPVVDAGPDQTACFDAAPFDLVGTPAGGTWSGTGITNAAAGTFDAALAGIGNYDIVYSYTDPATSCINSDTLVATVHPLPDPSFTNNPVGCIGIAESFVNISTPGASYSWDFGDGSTSILPDPTHTYTSVGTYTIQLIVNSVFGCQDSISESIDILEPPVALFTLSPNSGCAPVQVSFNNFSSGIGISHNWNFGNGSTFTGPTPSDVTYNQGVIADTTYYITLDVANFCGTVSYTDSVIAIPSPTAIFGPMFDVGCSPYVAEFANNSLGLPDTYEWDFGDGTFSNTDDSLFNHTFYGGTSDTLYTVMLVVTNACGTDTAYHDITVIPNSVNAFFNTPQTSGCEPFTVTFTQFSTGGNFYSWDFGDGNVSTAANPTHTFQQAGIYTVQLFINDGCSYDTSSAVIEVFPSPPVNFTWAPDSVCVNVPFQFTNLSGSLASIHWDFGDSDTSILSNPEHAYSNSGTYTVTLTGVGLTNGCTGVIQQNVYVATNPLASFTPSPNSGCIPLGTSFSNTSTNAQFFSWNFGDGNTSISTNPSHTYTSSGNFMIQLVAENINGCTDTAYMPVNAFPLPVAVFSVQSTDPCYQPVTSIFSNTSTGAVGFNWNLGNGQSSSLYNPITTYDAPGDYIVELIAENQFGCTDTAYDLVEIYQLPTALFTLDSTSGCQLYPIGITNNSLFADSVFWNFTEGTSTSFNPSYAFQSPGTYDITLMVYNNDGCGDTLSQPAVIEIFPTPTAAFSYENIHEPDPMNGTVAFSNESAGATSYYWHFGNGESTDENPSHRFEKFGIEQVMLIATNDFGCPDTAIINVEVMYFKGLYVPNALVYGHSNYEISHFIPKGVGLRTFYIGIYDTWGNLMWECSDLDPEGRPVCSWDGTFQGQPVPQDAYVWLVEARFLDESIWEGQEYKSGIFRRSGSVTVLR